MIIAIPSKGRAGNVLTTKIFKSAFLYVPESEVQQYKQFYKNVLGVPDSIKGITQTRNYILKQNINNDLVFIDDDLEYCGWIKKGVEKYKVIRITDEQTWIEEFERYFELTKQKGWFIWGTNYVGNNMTSYAWNPFLLNGLALGSCMGFVSGNKYLFDESFEVKEDYEISMRHIKNEGGLLSVRYSFMQHEHTKMAGGCRDSNRIKKEKKSLIKLLQKYPGWIKQAKHRGTSFSIQLNY